MKRIYIGAETVMSPLGTGIADNFSAVCKNRSGISLVPDAGFNNDSLYLAKILSGQFTFTSLVEACLQLALGEIDSDILTSDRLLLILSSTKAALGQDIADQFGKPVENLMLRFGLAHRPVVISNACISGVLAINAAGNFIRAGIYDHAIVIGCDMISDFVVYGFQSLFAVSEKPCAPFDAARNGITMGEGCGVVVVSGSASIFRSKPMYLLTGTTANDANHISGPSRTGEGLYRSVKKTMEMNGLGATDLDFISAHGTATVFNDEMESIAFGRLGMEEVPVNSLKGYFGHTLGAAGVIETAISMQMMRENVLIKSLGFEKPGTSGRLNIITENRMADLNTILKTASGFGGGNASLVIKKQ